MESTLFTIHVPVKHNTLIKKILTDINKNREVQSLWHVANINATQRLSMTDHGPVHYQIVANIALKLGRMLAKRQIEYSIVKDFQLTSEHAELVILLGSLLHDVGMSIQREDHEQYSLFLANNLLRELLDFLPLSERTIVISETLHTIISHRSDGRPLTLEAGIVRVADALDMTEGRSRIPYEKGMTDIYSLSATAIDDINISEGTKKPILITITLNNSTGIFQIDQLLKKKLIHSGLEPYINIHAVIRNKTEKNLLKSYDL